MPEVEQISGMGWCYESQAGMVRLTGYVGVKVALDQALHLQMLVEDGLGEGLRVGGSLKAQVTRRKGSQDSSPH